VRRLASWVSRPTYRLEEAVLGLPDMREERRDELGWYLGTDHAAHGYDGLFARLPVELRLFTFQGLGGLLERMVEVVAGEEVHGPDIVGKRRELVG